MSFRERLVSWPFGPKINANYNSFPRLKGQNPFTERKGVSYKAICCLSIRISRHSSRLRHLSNKFPPVTTIARETSLRLLNSGGIFLIFQTILQKKNCSSAEFHLSTYFLHWLIKHSPYLYVRARARVCLCVCMWVLTKDNMLNNDFPRHSRKDFGERNGTRGKLRKSCRSEMNLNHKFLDHFSKVWDHLPHTFHIPNQMTPDVNLLPWSNFLG